MVIHQNHDLGFFQMGSVQDLVHQDAMHLVLGGLGPVKANQPKRFTGLYFRGFKRFFAPREIDGGPFVGVSTPQMAGRIRELLFNRRGRGVAVIKPDPPR